MSFSQDRKKGTYNHIEVMSREERADYKWDKLKSLLVHAHEHSSAFRARLDGAGMTPGDVKHPEEWSSIPVLPKKSLPEIQGQGPRLGGLLTCDPGQLRRIFLSPGPIIDPEAGQKDFWGFAEAFYAAGFRAQDVVQITFSYHFTPAGLMMEEPLQEIGCAVFPAGPGNTQGQIDAMLQLKTNGFVGMASFLKIIADKAEKGGLDLRKDLDLDVAFVAAERLPESLRLELEDRLDMVIRQGYGTADLGCVAYECPEKSGMHLSSRCYVEICHPETRKPLPAGETGEVVVTPFNQAYPLIRFATGDLSFIREEKCPCGRTSARLGGILGRVDDTVKVKGQFMYPSQIGQALAVFPEIRAWKVVTSNPRGRDTITLHILGGPDLDQSRISKAFQDKIKLRPEINITEDESFFSEDGPRIKDQRTWS